MQLVVIGFVIAVGLGAMALQIKMQTTLWGVVADLTKNLPRWAAWLLRGILITAGIVGVTLALVFEWRRRR